MKPRAKSLAGRRHAPLAALALFFSAAARAAAQTEPEESAIRPFRLTLHEAAAVMNIEAQAEDRQMPGGTLRRDLWFAEPGVDLDLRGSIYHPNLLEFELRPQLGVSYQQVRLDPPGGLRQTLRALQRYHAGGTVLKQKAYATSFFLDRDRTYRDFDFFSRAQVDSLRYGGATGYNAGPVPVSVVFQHSHEEVGGGLMRPMHDDEESVTLSASHERGKVGRTRVIYEVNRFDRGDSGAPSSTGTAHSASLLDEATLSRSRKADLQSVVLFSRTEDRRQTNQAFAANENLSMEHAHRLMSQTHYGFSARRSGSVAEKGQDAAVALSHQLYESLASRLQFEGFRQDLRSPEATLASDRLGASLAETYNKRLGAWGHLSLGGEVRVDAERRRSTGTVIAIAEEAHVLNDANPVFLRQHEVQSVTRVTDPLGRAYTEGLDYLLIPQGALLEIRRVSGGLIPKGATVLVSYLAAAPRSGSFTTYGRSVQVRLDLFDDLVSLYARLNEVDNTGARFLILQNVTDRVAGAEVKWRWLRLSGEDEDFRSNISPFRTQRLTEALVRDGAGSSLLSLELNQTWFRFPGTGRTRYDNSLIARWHARLLPFLLYTLEGGVRRENGTDFDQRLTTVRSLLNFDYGKLTFDLGYEYEKESYLQDRRLKHYAFLHAKRRF